MNLGTATIIRGDARNLPLADNTVDLVVTSPPYFALRSYTDGGEHYAGQIGDEPTPGEFIDALLEVTRECVRVLKPSGSLWVNLGDKYSGYNTNGGRGRSLGAARSAQRVPDYGDERGPEGYGVPNKSLMGIPWRYALACIDDLGLILRAEIIWSKPNGLPESVTDRVRRSHEDWFMFTKRPRYFSAVDEIRELRSGEVVEPLPQHLPGCPLFVGPSDTLGSGSVGGGHEGVPSIQLFDLPDEEGANEGVERHDAGGPDQEHEVGSSGATVPLLVDGGDGVLGQDGAHLVDDGVVAAVDGEAKMRRTVATVTERHRPLAVDDSSEPGKVCTCGHNTYHTGALGKLPGSVWQIPTEPLRVPDHLGVDHFAAFPSEFPRRIILGWSPSGVCVACGEGRRPVVAKEYTPAGGVGNESYRRDMDDARDDLVAGRPKFQEMPLGRADMTATITGYSCACPTTDAPTRPAVVLDPFAGTGTTVAVAHALGRHGIGIDLSADYLRLADWRCNDPVLRAKVLRVERPKAVPDGQLDIFGGEAA